MALTKETVIDKIEILEDESIQVRRATHILEDGVRIGSPTYHRCAYTPGSDVSKEDARVQSHAATSWTDEVVSAYVAKSNAAT